MNSLSSCALAAMIVLTPMSTSIAQDKHSRGTVFAAQAGNNDAAREIAGGATAVFALSGSLKESKLAYELTYNDVALKQPWRIAIRNSAAGGVGEAVHVVCGPTSERKCPEASSGKIFGSWSVADSQPFTADLRFELTAGRLYVSLESEGDEDSPLRGQIDTSPLMIMPQTRVLSFGKPESFEAAGTGVVYVTEMPDGTTQIDYALTVTGMSSQVQGIELGNARDGKLESPGLDLLRADSNARAKPGMGGVTLSGVRSVSGRQAEALLQSMRTADGAADALLIRTEKSPQGEALSTLGEMPHQ